MIGVRLDVRKIDWVELAELLKDGYLMTAPKRLAKLHGPEAGDLPPVPAPRAKRTRTKRR